MKPKFALSLSFEGISLLCRVKGGWHRLGDVPLASEDLAAELEALRAMAVDIDGPEFRTKLILPNDQIKYLYVDTGRGSRAKRETAAIAALEQETPYSGDELAFDLVAAGRHTHVAAVARETLAEAEAFAVEHHFNPVSFVAIPQDGGFPQEPTFGVTAAATELLQGEPVDVDETIIAVIGTGAPSLDVEPVPESPAEADLNAEAQPDKNDPLSKERLEDSALTATLEEPSKTDPTKALPPKPEGENNEEAVLVSGFSSIRARRNQAAENVTKAPPLAGAERSVSGTNAPCLPPIEDVGARSEAPLRFDPKTVVAGLKPSEKTPEHGFENLDAGTSASSFFSRRAKEPRHPAEMLETSVAVADPKNPAKSRTIPATSGERRNMAVFGQRDTEVGGKPRHLGLILTVVLLVFLAGVAIWATVFLEDGVASLFRREPVPQIAEMEAESKPVEIIPSEIEAVDTNVLEPISPDSLTDTAEIEAMEDDNQNVTDSALIEAGVDEVHPTAPTAHEAEARYAVTGIWERAPEQPGTPGIGSTDNFYLTSIDRGHQARDAVALPSQEALAQDWPIAPPGNPVPFGTEFDLNDQGLVVANPAGAMNPGGVMVYLGKPAVLPNSFPERQKPGAGEGFSPEQVFQLSKVRPKARPDDLIEQNERASYGGRTLNELANVRPRLRPETNKAAEEQDTTPTEAAVTASVRPRARPANMAQLVARATPSDPVVATPVAATVTPTIPSSASVARQATIQNAINLNKINLIGVYGTTTSRRALVRLANGRYRKVQVGDRIDGGKVAAISDTELRYVKSGKNVILKLPKG